MQYSQKAYAKLNLTLDITGRRDDGFHEMSMVMQTISLCDEISLELNSTGRVTAAANFSYIPGDERNLAVKAALNYLRAVGDERTGVSIRLHKAIPVGAGMGGGSSDAAAVLRALNQAFHRRLSPEELIPLADTVGSDVAFCLRGGTQHALGKGEVLTPLTPLPDCQIVVCKPSFSISTPELFRLFDQSKVKHHPDTVGMMEAVAAGNLSGVCRRLYNVFEDVENRGMRTIREIKRHMLEGNAWGTVMTGTGSAVFGIFPPDSPDAEPLAARLKKEYGFAVTAKPTRAFEL